MTAKEYQKKIEDELVEAVGEIDNEVGAMLRQRGDDKVLAEAMKKVEYARGLHRAYIIVGATLPGEK